MEDPIHRIEMLTEVEWVKIFEVLVYYQLLRGTHDFASNEIKKRKRLIGYGPIKADDINLTKRGDRRKYQNMYLREHLI